MWSDSAPIVVFGDDWDRQVSTLQHLFRRVAQRHPVVWINAIGHRVPTLSRRDFRRAAEKFRAMVGRRNHGPRDGTFDVGASPTAMEIRASRLLQILREVVEERARSKVRTSC